MTKPPSEQPPEDEDVADEETDLATEDDDDEEYDESWFARPADTQIKIERFPDGLTIEVPPAGLWGGTHGLFFFALLWNGFMAVFSVLMLGVFFGGEAKKDQSVWLVPGLLSLFWLVGIGILLGSLNMGRRRAAIAVTGGSLMLIQTGIFGSKQRDWAAGRVSAIRPGPSGMTVNDKPVLELQIYDSGRHKFGLLGGRRDDELRWLGHELRTALGVPDIA
jgi:hypothetical protein